MTFVFGYIILDYRTSNWKFRQRKPVRYALITAFVIRILISTIFPIAFYADMLCGVVSSIALYPIGLEAPKHDLSVVAIRLWVIAQGGVLNVVLGIAWAILFALFALFMGPARCAPLCQRLVPSPTRTQLAPCDETTIAGKMSIASSHIGRRQR